MTFSNLLKSTLVLSAAWAAFPFIVSSIHAQEAVVQLERAFPNASFSKPVGIRFAPDGSNRAYVIEHGGRVKVLENHSEATDTTNFLDLSDRFETEPAGELYTIEFHPNYVENGYFFVRYKLGSPHRTLLSRFSRSEEDSLQADFGSEVILIEIETPNNDLNHHGGDIAFGLDGYLYMPMGDGGTHLDAAGNVQDLSILLGKVLRIDVDEPAEGLNYGIPTDNPFVGNDQGWREEIFAVGFRNPWRLTIDRETGDIWVGDVGEVTWEEVNRIESGLNYGWPVMEGPECLGGGLACDHSEFVPPLLAYGREDGVCITGGYVYRGSAIPELYGKYVYADFGTGNFWALDVLEPESGPDSLMHAWVNASSFGEDEAGELYLTNYFGGVFKFVRASTSSADEEQPPIPATARLDAPYPNPSTGAVAISFSADRPSSARLALYDLLGRKVRELFAGHVLPDVRREVTFDAQELPAGVYFCRLEIGGEVHVRKVVVAR